MNGSIMGFPIKRLALIVAGSFCVLLSLAAFLAGATSPMLALKVIIVLMFPASAALILAIVTAERDLNRRMAKAPEGESL